MIPIEMINETKNSIFSQANQQSQGALQLPR